MDYYEMTDQAVAEMFGQRIEQRRLEANIPQSTVAEEAGISENTYRAAIRGKVKLEVLIAILRCLGELQQLDNLLPDRPFSPIERLKLEGNKRQRASRNSAADNAESEESSEW